MTWTNGHMWKVFFMHFLIFFVTLGGLLALGVGLLYTAPLGSVMAGGLYEELRLADGQAPQDAQRVD